MVSGVKVTTVLVYSAALIPSSLMIGHYLSASAFTIAPRASGVCRSAAEPDISAVPTAGLAAPFDQQLALPPTIAALGPLDSVNVERSLDNRRNEGWYG